MQYQKLVSSLTPEIVDNFKRAVELGRWPDGRNLTPGQREHCMQAIIAYGELALSVEDRVGYIDTGDKMGDTCDSDAPEALQWKE